MITNNGCNNRVVDVDGNADAELNCDVFAAVYVYILCLTFSNLHEGDSYISYLLYMFCICIIITL